MFQELAKNLNRIGARSNVPFVGFLRGRMIANPSYDKIFSLAWAGVLSPFIEGRSDPTRLGFHGHGLIDH